MTYPPMPVKEKKIRKPFSESVPDVILAVLAVAGLVISGWSLGTLLHDTAGAPWPVAGFAVAVFDLVAMGACVLVYQRRHDPWSALGARLVMTGALVASAAVNGAHGYALGGWTTAAILAAAPLSFEVMFELRHRTLTALVWILFRKETMSRLRYDVWGRVAIPVGTGRLTLDGSPQQIADTVNRIEAVPEPLASAPEPLKSRAERLSELRERLAEAPNLTGPEAADLLGVSLATAKRDLVSVRAAQNGDGS
ncbi:hypothetical protein [Streptomyces albicerus]|uniref:hypothetical protein n=1 Tax=Streptomyces albicerus TaxID=2569859 RepID=UPI00124B4689|nr:hypothetical protein [Streptomyces albicerus]